MSCKYVCDGCGKEAPAETLDRDYHKPRLWFQRGDEHGLQDACSRECIPKIAKETGKTDVVLSFL